jgi:hypothetical protein
MKFSPILLLALLFFTTTGVCTQARFYPRQFADFQTAMGGQIPYPAENLIRRLGELDPKSQAFAEIIPHGRSLERTLTDLKFPRTVLNWRSGSTMTPYLLYLAFTPKAEQIQVIAWDWNKHRFEFMLVEDYAPGKVARIQTVNRAICTSCHQGGGPIFSRSPWGETTAQPFIRTSVRHQSQDSLSRWLMDSGRSSGVLTDAPTLDVQVQTTTQFLQMQNLCRDACGSDLECRKGVLYTALIGNIARADISQVPSGLVSSMRQAMSSSWPGDRFSLPDPRLESRTVDFNHPLDFSKEEDPLRVRKAMFRVSPEDGTGKLIPKYSQCWSFAPEQVDEIQSWGRERIAEAMHTGAVLSLLANWLPSEASILSALRSVIAESKFFDRDVSRFQSGTVALFQAYCSSCHSGPSNIPPILPLSDLAALSAYTGSAQRTVKDLLESSLMPPRDSPQPTDPERAEMISGLKE